MDSANDQFLELLLRHQTEVKAFIGSVIRNRQARDDVFQEVAVILWKRFAEYDPCRPFGAWARGIAVNKILQELRQQRRF
ncbi:MAG: sigma-70 family RNA polymerase sigma factor [Planctomycetes bacterium]|nr:sigma-70 family RNA polymerase sigma factor [Planctomycetota bacterium]